MANVKFSELLLASPLDGTELIALVQSGNSRGVNFNVMFNASNLPFIGGQLDTIQDIDINASPTFYGGVKSYKSNSVVAVSQNITLANIGTVIYNVDVTTVDLTIPFGAGFPGNSEFEMLRVGNGAFSVTAQAGVELNGVDGGSISLPEQFDRLVIRNIAPDKFTAIAYSGGLSGVDLQTAYLNGTGTITINTLNPFTIQAASPGDGEIYFIDSDNPMFTYQYTAQTFVPGEIAGTLRFNVLSDSLADVNVARMQVFGNDFSTGSVSARVVFDARVSGTTQEFISINDSNNDQLEFYRKTVVNDTGSISADSTSLFEVVSTTKGSRPFPSMTQLEFDAILSPANGLMGWDTDSDRIRVNKGTPGSPDYDEVAYISDVDVAVDSNFGEMFFNDNATETVIASAGVPVKVAGTYVSGLLADFTQVSGTLTHIGTTRTFHVTATATVNQSISADDVSLLLFKDGSVIAKSKQTVNLGPASPSDHTITVQCLVSLANTENVEVYIQNNVSNDNIIVSQLNCIATQTGAKVGGGVDGEAGNPNLQFKNSVNFSFSSIQTQYYQRIDDIVSIYGEFIGSVPTATPENYIDYEVPFTENFVSEDDVTGTGIISRVDGARVSNSDVVVMGTCRIPETIFPVGVWTDFINTYDGINQNIVPADSLKRGDIIEYEIVGSIHTSAGGATTGDIRFLFGGFTLKQSYSLSDSSGPGNGAFKIIARITMEDSSNYRYSIYGMYNQADGTVKSIFSGSTGATFPVVTNVPNAIDLQYRRNAAGGSELRFIAESATVRKINSGNFSSPTKVSSIKALPGTKNVRIQFQANENDFQTDHRLSVNFTYQIQ